MDAMAVEQTPGLAKREENLRPRMIPKGRQLVVFAVVEVVGLVAAAVTEEHNPLLLGAAAAEDEEKL